ncbi:hypothetical protein HPNQ4216_1686 [Helicobacter pylori NQ4216]|nr:hypothetical protein HPNQ4216_1686 [Helicobacter pylori NQ4216]
MLIEALLLSKLPTSLNEKSYNSYNKEVALKRKDKSPF